MKPILISGIQPTGRLHLGNYLGALKNFVELQNSGKYQCYFFIADLHALTENPKAEDLHRNIIDLAAEFLAAGLDPKKSVIFLQSTIPAHSELDRILQSLAPFGETRRMTQFKEKGGEQDNANVGLFTYPILMAADILLYDAQIVPVGEDQLQHLELARTLARKFNSKFGQSLIEPKALMTTTPRLMSIDDPTKKMSKSRAAGCVFIDDEPEIIVQKFKTAVTDSGKEIKFDMANKPGISNLLTIMSSVSGKAIPELEKQFAGKNYGEFKSAIAEKVADHFAEFRINKKKLMAKPATLKSVLNKGSAKANKVAEKKLAEVKEKIGLKI